MAESQTIATSSVISREREFADKIATLPRLNLNARQLCDLELLMNRGFAPLKGFLNEADYRSVVETMRLTDGSLWPIPVVLDLAEANFSPGSELVLCDEYGKPLAILAVESIFRPDKVREAELVYGTLDRSHPGVQYLLEQSGGVYVGGAIEPISPVDRHDFREHRHSPAELKDWFQKNGWDRVIAFQTRNPLHRAHVELIRRAAEANAAKVLLHPVVGLTQPDDIDYITRVRCYKRLCETHLADLVKLSLLPLAMRMAGPREAVWHAIIRKNHGCTHFIVGRDHAGPKDAAGRPFYQPYAAQELTMAHASEIGVEIIPMKELVYVEGLGRHMAVDEVPPEVKTSDISGSEIRRRLSAGEEIPEWFSYPEVIEELRRGFERSRRRGFTVFFTGLPSAGKSTIARIVAAKLLELQDREVTLLDGDVVRQNLSVGLGFSRQDRNVNIGRIGYVASEIVKHGGIAVCAAIAPFAESREANRRRVGHYGSYVEIHVATPVGVCRARDTKGLYRKAELGLLKNFTGVDDPYEAPEKPEIVLNTTDSSPDECAAAVIDYLRGQKLINA